MRPKQNNADHAIDAEVVLCCQFESPHYDLAQLMATVQRAVDAADDQEARVDVQFKCLKDGEPGAEITKEIKDAIAGAGIVILEISDLNPNVLMELGAAWQADKPMILLREASVAEEPLPFNISGLRWETYRHDRLNVLEANLTRMVADTLRTLDLDALAPDSIDRFLARYFRIITTTEDFTETVRDQLERCEVNFYYIGSASLTPITDEFLDFYRQHLGPISSHRIVYLRTVREVLEAGSRQDAVEHCIWLARYYRLVRDGVMQLYHSDAVGHSGTGMSLLVFDQEEVDLALGRIVRGFNHRALTLRSEPFAAMAHAYAQQLAGRATPIEPEDFGRYFHADGDPGRLPEAIAAAVDAELETLREASRGFVAGLVNT